MLNNPSYVIEALIVVALDTPTSFTAEAGQGEVTLKWTDPVDKYATPEGETAQDPQQLVAKWSHTLVVRNTDHQPESPDDGTVILTSSVRNQYQTNGYVDNTVVNGTPYYYGVFAISTAGVPSAGTFASATPIAGTPLSQLAEGTLIKILENGSPVEFYLAKHSYEPGLNGEGRELVVRKDGYGSLAYNNSGKNSYQNGTLDNWLNNNYKNLLSENLKQKIGTTTFYYTAGPGSSISPPSASTLSRSIFILSVTEYGGTLSVPADANVEGSLLPIYTTLLSGVDSNNRPWTRTPRKTSDYQAISLWDSGGDRGVIGEISNVTTSWKIFPCFTLPSVSFVDQDLNLIEE